MNDHATALFIRDGDGFRATRLSAGPWSPEALHGGPPAALLARAIEGFEDGKGFMVTRVTVELLKPVPFERLEISTRFERPGRNVQIVEATLRTEQKEVARARGLRICRSEVSLPDDLPSRNRSRDRAYPGPSEGSPLQAGSGPFHPGFHSDGVEHRFVEGSFEESGPAVDWIRVRYPLLEDEPLSPLCRTCAVADFGNGISGLLAGTHTYINPDLTVYLHRYPEGEWICLDSVTRVQAEGIALAQSQLGDERGPIGIAAQSLIVSEREEGG
ncbi:MAG: thioesterase family protein [bacterium]